jgi:6-phosphogluconolactonase
MSITGVEVFDDSDGLVAAAGERLIGVGNRLMSYLRAQAARIDWAKVHLFWGDERYVAEDDDDRNDKQARETLLDHIDIPARNVHAMPASDGEFGGDIAAAALSYEQLLAANAEPGDPAPNFDVHLLGVGPEGHINSLFPNTPAVRETARLVVEVDDSPKPPPQRITLTLPAIQRSREVWLLVSGAEKAEAVAAAVGGADPVSVPAAGAIGREGTIWFLGTQAAAKLPAD